MRDWRKQAELTLAMLKLHAGLSGALHIDVSGAPRRPRLQLRDGAGYRDLGSRMTWREMALALDVALEVARESPYCKQGLAEYSA